MKTLIQKYRYLITVLVFVCCTFFCKGYVEAQTYNWSTSVTATCTVSPGSVRVNRILMFDESNKIVTSGASSRPTTMKVTIEFDYEDQSVIDTIQLVYSDLPLCIGDNDVEGGLTLSGTCYATVYRFVEIREVPPDVTVSTSNATTNFCFGETINLSADFSGNSSYIPGGSNTFWFLTFNGNEYRLSGETGKTLDFTFDKASLEALTGETDLAGNYSFRYYAQPCPGGPAKEDILGNIYLYPSAPPITNITHEAPECKGGDGKILITHGQILGGISYTYSVKNSDGQGDTWQKTFDSDDTDVTVEINTTVLTNNLSLTPGDYDIRIEATEFAEDDANDYCLVTGTETILDASYNLLTSTSISLSNLSDPTCAGGKNGGATLTVADGYGSDGFQWKGVNTSFVDFTDRTANIPDTLGSDPYTIIIQDDCGDQTTKTIDLDDGPSFTPSITIDQDVSCNSDGTLSISVNPTPSSVQYSLNGGGYQVSNTFSGQSPSQANQATIMVNGQSGCVYSETDTDDGFGSIPATSVSSVLPAPAACTNGNGKILIGGISKDGDTTAIVNFGYSITVDGTGASAGSGTRSNYQSFEVSVPADQTYDVAFTDNCGGSAITGAQNIAVTEPESVNIVSAVTSYEVNCFDGGYSGISIDVNDGKPNPTGNPYTVTITRESDGSSLDDSTFVSTYSGGSFLLPDLYRGTYDIVAQDSCGITDTVEVVVSVQGNASEIELTTFSISQQVICNGADDGIIVVKADGGYSIGGTKDYIVSLMKDGSDSITSHESSGAANYFEFQGLAPGLYYPIITDGNGCSEPDFSSNTLTITEPTQVSITSVDTTHFGDDEVEYDQDENLYIRCNNKVVDFTPVYSGGTTPYTFEFSGGTVSGTLTSAPPYLNLGAGTYTFKVTDDHDCDSVINFTLINPPALILNLEDEAPYSHGASVECYGDNDGKITATASGGVGSYDYYLVEEDDTREDISGSSTFSPLEVGNSPVSYTFTVTDYLGCEGQETKELSPPDPVTVVATPPSPTNGVEILCKDGTASVEFIAAGGLNDGFSLHLSIDDGASFVPQWISAGTNSIPLEDESYMAFTTDGFGCYSIDTVEFTLTEPEDSLLLNTPVIEPPRCIDGDDGEITLSATGGTSGGAYTFSIKENESDLYTEDLYGDAVTFLKPANEYDPKTYFVKVTDDNNCFHEGEAVMRANDAPFQIKTLRNVPPTCHGGTNGYIDVRFSNCASK